VDLGNFLIKKAAQHLLAELPQLQHLVTLSPIPGFRTWLITKLQAGSSSSSSSTGMASSDSSQEQQLLQPHEADTVALLSQQLLQQQEQATTGSERTSSVSRSSSSSSSAAASASAALLQLVQTNTWLQLPEEQQQGLQPVLLRLCARYLLIERRRGWALDPVEHFHLKNGAWLWRINTRWAAADGNLPRL
jgi:hypothetical protein